MLATISRFLRPAVTLAGLAATTALLFAGPSGAVTLPGTPTPVGGVLTGRVSLPSTLASFVGSAPSLGAALPSSPARALIALAHRDQAGLLRFDSQVSDPGSRIYRHFLTPAQFDARFAPSSASVAAVEAFARGLRPQRPGGSLQPRVRVSQRHRGADGHRLRHDDRALYRSMEPRCRRRTARPACRRACLGCRSPGSRAWTPRDRARPQASAGHAACAGVRQRAAEVLGVVGPEPRHARLPEPTARRMLPNVPQGYTPQQLEGAYGVAGRNQARPRRQWSDRGGDRRLLVPDASPLTRTTWSKLHGLPAPSW